MKIIVELILLATIIICVWSGYKKGLVMEVGAIIAIIISIYMGNLLSETFSPSVAPVMQPFVSGYMDGSEGVIGKNLDSLLTAEEAQLSVEDALKRHPEVSYELAKASYMDMGIYEDTADTMAVAAAEYAQSMEVPLTAAIVEIMCDHVTYYLGFILFFVLILIIITAFGNILNLSFKIPEQDQLNDMGGLISGAIIGIVYCCIIAWALKFTGMLLHEEKMSGTIITGLFLKLDIMSKILPF